MISDLGRVPLPYVRGGELFAAEAEDRADGEAEVTLVILVEAGSEEIDDTPSPLKIG